MSRMLDHILCKVDDKTQVIRLEIKTKLSPQERKVLVAAAHCNDANGFSLKDLHRYSRIFQSNHLSAIVGRLVKKNFFTKIDKGVYDFASEDLRLHLRYRLCGQSRAHCPGLPAE
jgi:hypothetical protein